MLTNIIKSLIGFFTKDQTRNKKKIQIVTLNKRDLMRQERAIKAFLNPQEPKIIANRRKYSS